MIEYTTDGKGNIYATATGKRVWSGDPRDVIMFLEERDSEERWANQYKQERDKARAEVERVRQIAFKAVDRGLVLAFENEQLRGAT